MRLQILYENIDMNKAVAEVMGLIRGKKLKPAYAIQLVASRYGIDKTALAKAMRAKRQTHVKPELSKITPEVPKTVQGSLF
jgi:hypothetical protein